MMNEREDDSRETDEDQRETRQPAADTPGAPDAAGGTAAPEPSGGSDSESGSDVGEDEAGTPAAATAGLGAFEDSGSFFRDRVARTLAEQGFNLREDGTWGPQEEPEESGTGDGEKSTAADETSQGETTTGSETAAADSDKQEKAPSSAAVGAGGEAAEAPAAEAATSARDGSPAEAGESASTGAADSDVPEKEDGLRPQAGPESSPASAEAAGDGGEDGAAASDEPRSWFTPRAPSRAAADAPSTEGTGGGQDESTPDADTTLPHVRSVQSAEGGSETDSPQQDGRTADSAASGAAEGDSASGDTPGDTPGTPTATTQSAAAASAAPVGAGAAEPAATRSGESRASADDGAAQVGGPERSDSDKAPADSATASDTPAASVSAEGTSPSSSADSDESRASSAKSPAAGSAGAGAGAAAAESTGGDAAPRGRGGAERDGRDSAKSSSGDSASRTSTFRLQGSGASSGPSGTSSAAAAGAASAAAGAASGPPGSASADGGTGTTGQPASAGPVGPGPSGPSNPTPPPGGGGPTPPGGGDGGGSTSQPPKPLWWRMARGTLIAFAACAVAVLAGFGIAYATIDVPDVAKEEAVNQGSTFYYADGETQFAERGVDREPVDYEQIPENVQEAVISAEDRGYWDSPGVSITGTFRAVWFTVTGQQVQGGSTITQQFVRNYFEGISREQTITRKLKEIIIALKVDQSGDMDKQWVMEQYLNTIYFGRNAYGIQSAAQAYYHKDVGDLTASESAFLAAAIQQPSLYGQADSKTTSQMEGRWEYVVEGMVEGGDVTRSEADKMKFPEPKAQRPANSVDLSGSKGYMLQQAMQELKELGYSEDNINRGGYKVVTTFDQQTMEMAKNAVEDTVDVDSLPDGVQAGLTAVNPSNGEVVGFYGGQNYLENQYDSAFNGSAQAGSAFKPYVLAAALEQGYSLNTQVNGNSPIEVGGATINNYDHTSHGPTSLVEATRMSLNTGYVQLAQEVGPEKVRQTAFDAGIPKSMIKENQAVPAIALGVSNVRPVDQATGFATFANGGEHVETHVVREVLNKEGENERPEPESNQALSQDTAADVTYALQQVVQSGTGTTAALPDGRPVAGKTGTTDDSVAAWFSGYTPQMSAAVGVYNGENEPFSVPGWGELSGGTLPATIWNNFMTQAMAGREVKQFPEPAYSGEVHDFAPDPPPTQEETAPAEPPQESSRPPEETDPEPPPPEDTAPPSVPPPEPEEPTTNPIDPGFSPAPGGGEEAEGAP